MASFAKLWTTEPHDILERWLGDGSQDGWTATTVPAAFAHKLKLHPQKVVLRRKMDKEQKQWEEWTWTKYHTEVHRCALGLIASGFQAHDCVSILGWNSPEWFVATMGAIFAGGMAAGVYTTNSADGLQYIVTHSRSTALFVDGNVQLAKGLQTRAQCPLLKQIIVWGPEAPDTPQHGGFVVGWGSFQASGSESLDAELQRRVAAQRPGAACYLSYTSGTTGNPKAVMMSHDVALFGFRSWFTHGWKGLDVGLEERNISYMPLSHIGGSVDIFATLARDDNHHSTVHFAFPDAMQGSLEVTMCDVHPTYLAAVPRIWQKLEGSLRQLQRDGVKDGEALRQLGLQNIKWALSGSAPIEPETLNYFQSFGIRIDEIYGMTETNVSIMGNVDYMGVGTVGAPAVPGSVRLDPASGEICVRHRCLMMGYMYEPERTMQTFDADGWHKTGDIGKQDANGCYIITGRIKELIITAGGENIPPVPIEFELKDLLPCISNAVVIGDGQKMLVCLFTPKLEANPAGTPMWLPNLALEAKDVDPNAKTAADAQRSEAWRDEIERGVQRYNKEKALSRAQHIRKWALLPNDFVFAVDQAELTPTLKLKRDVVFSKYAGVIKELYGSDFKQSKL